METKGVECALTRSKSKETLPAPPASFNDSWPASEQLAGHRALEQGSNLCWLITALEQVAMTPGIMEVLAELPRNPFSSTLSKCVETILGGQQIFTRREVYRNILFNYSPSTGVWSIHQSDSDAKMAMKQVDQLADPVMFSVLKKFPATKMHDFEEAMFMILTNMRHFACRNAVLLNKINKTFCAQVCKTQDKCLFKDKEARLISKPRDTFTVRLDAYCGSPTAETLINEGIDKKDTDICTYCLQLGAPCKHKTTIKITLGDQFRLEINRRTGGDPIIKEKTLTSLAHNSLTVKTNQGTYEAHSIGFHAGKHINTGHFYSALRLPASFDADAPAGMWMLTGSNDIEIISEEELMQTHIGWNACSFTYRRQEGSSPALLPPALNECLYEVLTKSQKNQQEGLRK